MKNAKSKMENLVLAFTRFCLLLSALCFLRAFCLLLSAFCLLPSVLRPLPYSMSFPLSPGKSIWRCTHSGALPFDSKRS